MVKAVIFDIDGTIIDSVGAHIEAWRRTFARFGKEVSDEEIRRQIGEGSDDMLPVFFSPDELHRFRPDLEKYRGELFRREYLPSLKAFPKVRELFERIKNDGKKIALASTAKGEQVNIYKEIAHISDVIDCAVCSEEVAESKPHGDICRVALQKLGNPTPAKVISIGDTAYDAERSKKQCLHDRPALWWRHPGRVATGRLCCTLPKPCRLACAYGRFFLDPKAAMCRSIML
jgi:HAD superfamily hydrolase (TIGR01549 family)